MASNAEEEFVSELQRLRIDCEQATQYFYAYVATFEAMNKHDSVYEAINGSARYWNTLLGGLQNSFFIVLGRIFGSGQHNIEKLLKVAELHQFLFERKALEGRKRDGNPNPWWIDDYLNKAFYPKQPYFDRLKRYEKKYRSVYFSRCQVIRSKVIAHNVITDSAELSNLFSKTRYKDIARILLFLESLHDSLWQLYFNGIKTTLRLGKLNELPDSIIERPEEDSDYLGQLTAKDATIFLKRVAGLPTALDDFVASF